MTLRRARADSTSKGSSWGRTLAVAVLALAVSAAPRAADLCDVACGRAQGHANAESRVSGAGATAMPMAAVGPMAAAAAAAPEHCAKHAAGSRVVASAHACQPHTHLLHVAATDLGVTRTGAAEAGSGASAQARLSAPLSPTVAIALFVPASPPPRFASRVELVSAQSSLPRPLAFAPVLRV